MKKHEVHMGKMRALCCGGVKGEILCSRKMVCIRLIKCSYRQDWGAEGTNLARSQADSGKPRRSHHELDI